MPYSVLRGGVARAALTTPLLAILSVLTSAPAHAASPGDPADPTYASARFDRPFFVGAYLGDAGSRTGQVQGAMDGFARMTGKRPALVKIFQGLDVDYSARGWAGQLV